MILNAQPKQLTLKDDGQILWQADPSNPLPGVPVAMLRKGEARLKPAVDLLDTDVLAGQDRAAVAAFVAGWVDQHINTVLAPLTGLVQEDGIAGPAKDIAVLLHDALGIMPRHELEPMIAALDPEARKVLRQRRVRLGPVLVFVPELNKPAAVKLRGVLWWLWNDRPLPAPLPKDGVVSMIVDEAVIDPVYQRAIGYPVYGGRAIRVDMLDRLISAIYDSAKDGTFKATHAMAEWMGCSIPDLYKIIEAMGHSKTHDPAEQQPVVEAEKEQAPASAEPAPATEPVAAVKPELATFRLKRGKASGTAPAARAPRPAQKPRPAPANDKSGQKSERHKDKPRGRDRKPERAAKAPVSFEARPEHAGDSPFAMLEQLKAGMKDK